MSMNGGRNSTRSSISASRPLTSPPRSGGMISKLISGSLARARCSVTFNATPPADMEKTRSPTASGAGLRARTLGCRRLGIADRGRIPAFDPWVWREGTLGVRPRLPSPDPRFRASPDRSECDCIVTPAGRGCHDASRPRSLASVPACLSGSARSRRRTRGGAGRSRSSSRFLVRLYVPRADARGACSPFDRLRLLRRALDPGSSSPRCWSSTSSASTTRRAGRPRPELAAPISSPPRPPGPASLDAGLLLPRAPRLPALGAAPLRPARLPLLTAWRALLQRLYRGTPAARRHRRRRPRRGRGGAKDPRASRARPARPRLPADRGARRRRGSGAGAADADPALGDGSTTSTRSSGSSPRARFDDLILAPDSGGWQTRLLDRLARRPAAPRTSAPAAGPFESLIGAHALPLGERPAADRGGARLRVAHQPAAQAPARLSPARRLLLAPRLPGDGRGGARRCG